MGLLIALTVLAPFIGAAAVLDRRSRHRRRRVHASLAAHNAPRREIDNGLDIGDLGA
jgi:hypothetical protein